MASLVIHSSASGSYRIPQREADRYPDDLPESVFGPLQLRRALRARRRVRDRRLPAHLGWARRTAPAVVIDLSAMLIT